MFTMARTAAAAHSGVRSISASVVASPAKVQWRTSAAGAGSAGRALRVHDGPDRGRGALRGAFDQGLGHGEPGEGEVLAPSMGTSSMCASSPSAL